MNFRNENDFKVDLDYMINVYTKGKQIDNTPKSFLEKIK
jgi:hypothetical protein